MRAVCAHFDSQPDVLPVIVTFAGNPDRLAAYRKHLDLDVPVLADVGRELYHLLGAGRGSARAIWSPGTVMAYVQLLRRGRRLRRPVEDTRQLGADAIIDRDGRLRRIWLPPSPDTRPPISELAAVIDELRT